MARRAIVAVLLILLAVMVVPALAQTVTIENVSQNGGALVGYYQSNGLTYIIAQSYPSTAGVLTHIGLASTNTTLPITWTIKNSLTGSALATGSLTISSTFAYYDIPDLAVATGTYYLQIEYNYGGNGNLQGGIKRSNQNPYAGGQQYTSTDGSNWTTSTAFDLMFGVMIDTTPTATPTNTPTATNTPVPVSTYTPTPTLTPTATLDPASAWCYASDFRTQDHGWSNEDGATRNSTGWIASNPTYPDSLFITRQLGQSTYITNASVLVTGGFLANQGAYYYYYGGDTYPNNPSRVVSAPSFSTQSDIAVNDYTSHFTVGVDSQTGNIEPYTGSLYMVILQGLGVNPFGVDNCNTATPSPTPTSTDTPTATATLDPTVEACQYTATYAPGVWGAVTFTTSDSTDDHTSAPGPTTRLDNFQGSYYGSQVVASIDVGTDYYIAFADVTYSVTGGGNDTTYVSVEADDPRVWSEYAQTSASITETVRLNVLSSGVIQLGVASGYGDTINDVDNATVSIEQITLTGIVDDPVCYSDYDPEEPNTPTPTSTVTQTATVTTTASAQPSFTPYPSSTPYPTNTPISSPTVTRTPSVQPSYTPNATYTPYPTFTPIVSSTPDPNATADQRATINAVGTNVAIVGTNVAQLTPDISTPNATSQYSATYDALEADAYTITPGQNGTPQAQLLGTATAIAGGLYDGLDEQAGEIAGDVGDTLNSATGLLVDAGNAVRELSTIWDETAAWEPPANVMPDCENAPVQNQICGVYYILDNTLFAGVGVLIIPAVAGLAVMSIITRIVRRAIVMSRLVERLFDNV